MSDIMLLLHRQNSYEIHFSDAALCVDKLSGALNFNVKEVNEKEM